MEAQRPEEQDDEGNPYAPPQSTFVEEGFQPITARARFTVEDIAGWSWMIYKSRLPHCLGVFWGVVAVNWVCQMSIVLIDRGITSLRDPTLSLLSQFASFFFSFVVAVWLTIGQNRALLKIARGEGVAVEDLFRGGPFVLTTILSYIAFFAILAGPGLLVYFLAGAFLVLMLTGPSLVGVLAILFGSLASTMVVIYLVARLGLFYFVVFDQYAGVFSSLAITWRLCRRHVATIILVYFLGLAINLAGLLMLCVGLIFTLPLSSLLLAVTYHALTSWGTAVGRPTADEPSSDVQGGAGI
jgi:hypothetical protein